MDDASSVGGDDFWDLNSQASHAKDDQDWDDTRSETSSLSQTFSQSGTDVSTLCYKFLRYIL